MYIPVCFSLQRASTPDMMEGYHDPVYEEALLQNIPEQFKDYTLEKLVHNRIELEHFRVFLADNYASMDIMCWMDIEAFRRITHTDERKRDLKAKEIKTKYLNKKYFFGPNSPAGKEGQDKVCISKCLVDLKICFYHAKIHTMRLTIDGCRPTSLILVCT